MATPDDAGLRAFGDRAAIGTLKRLEESAGLFLVKRNRGQTDERLLALVIPVPAFCPLRFLMLKRFHETRSYADQDDGYLALKKHVV